MRTWSRIEDSRDKPCLILRESPLWLRLADRLAPKRFCWILERREHVVLLHLSNNKAEEIDMKGGA